MENRTAKEYLALGDDELGVEAAKVLAKKPWKHDWQEGFWDEPGTMAITLRCRKCKFFAKDMKRDEPSEYCTVPNPLDVTDLGEALKQFRKHKDQCFGAVNTKLLMPAMREIYKHYTRTGGHIERQEMFRWFLFEAPAEALFIAACLAAEGSKE